jgi:hypothetical protein
MFPDYSSTIHLDNRLLRPDRRPNPRAAEIQLRVRRQITGAGA